MNIFVTILLTGLMFGLIIFLHELGHFIAAKSFKVKVNEFSLGMGPRILGFEKGETKYNLRLLPIGGYVNMEGEEEESDHPRSFQKQKVWKRMIICAAGVFMNFILGLIISIILVSTSDGLAGTTVKRVNLETSPLKVGDEIVSISGYRVVTGSDISFGISRSDPTGKTQLIELETDFVVLRDGKKVTLNNVKPFVRVLLTNGEEQDISSFYVEEEEKTVLNVIKHGFFEAISYVRTTILGLADLITGRVGIDGLGGVVKVGQVVGEAASIGISSFMMLVAMISINIGVMNFLPIPALDGGRIVLLIYEGIFRKKLNSKLEYGLISVSMILLFALMIFVTIKDVISIF